MTVVVVDGKKFPGVEYGTATGIDNKGYVIGSTPVIKMLHVDNENFQARLIGLKYSRHLKSDPPSGVRPKDEYVRMTMLVGGGPWLQRLWKITKEENIELRLEQPGDFIAWEPGVTHSWVPGDAMMLTVSFARILDAENNY